jgi:hypothetical protein
VGYAFWRPRTTARHAPSAHPIYERRCQQLDLGLIPKMDMLLPRLDELRRQ